MRLTENRTFESCSDSWCLIEIFEAASHAKPVVFMSIEGKGFSLERARQSLARLEEELSEANPATADELTEYFRSESSYTQRSSNPRTRRLLPAVAAPRLPHAISVL